MFFKTQKPDTYDISLPARYDKLKQSDRRLVRELYVTKQNGMCYHCECPLSGEPSPDVSAQDVNSDLFPSGFFKHPVHLHHSHDTGLTIGAVHAHCNAVLWEHHGE